ncbi:MAG: DUF1294 domain-containing protein [Phycisphaeraceae bacterium]
MQTWLIILAADLLLMSVVTLCFYAWDKRQARKRGWRIPEKRLHVLSLLGGWPGALLGQRWLRHKSIKSKFRVVFWLTVVGHVGVALAITYLVWNSRK